MTTAHLREKYAKRPHGNTEQRPAGGNDVIVLCDALDEMVGLVEWCVDGAGLSTIRFARETMADIYARLQ